MADKRFLIGDNLWVVECPEPDPVRRDCDGLATLHGDVREIRIKSRLRAVGKARAFFHEIAHLIQFADREDADRQEHNAEVFERALLNAFAVYPPLLVGVREYAARNGNGSVAANGKRNP